MTLGLKDLYYAVCTEADGVESYGTPKKMSKENGWKIPLRMVA